jgi:hypothetical protein
MYRLQFAGVHLMSTSITGANTATATATTTTKPLVATAHAEFSSYTILWVL